MNLRPKGAGPLLLGVLAIAAAPSAVFAQEPPAAAATNQDFSAEFDALTARFETAMAAYYNEQNALYNGFDADKATAEEKAALRAKAKELEAKDPSPTFVKEFEALAQRAAGSEVEVRALCKVVELDHARSTSEAADTAGRKALDKLIAEHVQSAAISKLPGLVARAEWFDRKVRETALRKLMSDSSLDEIKAASTYALATMLNGYGAGADDVAEAHRLFAEIQKKYADIAGPRRGTTFGSLAAGQLFELDHLQIGMQAPEFEVIDENGAKFKLSDYKGKVVVVDFWGNW
jgi:thiol-disulfide isomerase/thioredoxin